MRRAIARAGLLAAAAAAAACRPSATPAPPLSPATGTAAVRPETPSVRRLVVVPKGAARPETKGAVAWVEVSATNAARERGLMGRDRLEPDHGMLFVYAKPVRRQYWMKDCVMALDVAFIRADGRIARLGTLPPGAGLPDDRVARLDSEEPVICALEMEAGWFRSRGLGEGDPVDVSEAVRGVAAE